MSREKGGDLKPLYFRIGVSVAFALMILGAYLVLVPRIYEVEGVVVVHRQRVENPHGTGEEEKNRWIWVRDGMGLKEALLSDRIWIEQLPLNPMLKSRYDRFLYEHKKSMGASHLVDEDCQIAFAQALVKKLSVEFTGGDSYSYIFRVRDEDPNFAKVLVQILISRIQEKLILDGKKAYEATLNSLERSITSSINKEFQDYLKQSEKQLKLSSLLFDSLAPTRVEIVKTPHLPLAPIWPKPSLLFLLAVLMGGALGMSWQYLKGIR